MKILRVWLICGGFFPAALMTLAAVPQSAATAATLYQSGTLGPKGIPLSELTSGSLPGANITAAVFEGVRFELRNPAVTTQVGGHFVGSGSLFGAIVKLENPNDFPNSSNLSTPDVVGTTTLLFPASSDEVLGTLSANLQPGWYAVVFGTGLFGATGNGAMPLNNPDIGSPSYIAFASSSWVNLAPSDGLTFANFRFVVEGSIVPEPSALTLVIASILIAHRMLRFGGSIGRLKF